MLLLLKKVTWLSLVTGQTYAPSRGCTAVDRSVQSFYTEGICAYLGATIQPLTKRIHLHMPWRCKHSCILRGTMHSYIECLLWGICCWCLVAKSCLTLSNPKSCSPPSSSVHGISQARILEWVAISFSRGSLWPREWTRVSCTGRGVILYRWATREAHCKAYTTAGPLPTVSSVSLQ